MKFVSYRDARGQHTHSSIHLRQVYRVTAHLWSASLLLLCYRCHSLLECRVLRRGRIWAVLLQVHPGCVLVGRSYYDYSGLWWHEVTFVSASCPPLSFRCGSLLECRLLRRSRLRELFLQVNSWCVLVGRSYDDNRGLWWHDVRCTQFSKRFSSYFFFWFGFLFSNIILFLYSLPSRSLQCHVTMLLPKLIWVLFIFRFY